MFPLSPRSKLSARTATGTLSRIALGLILLLGGRSAGGEEAQGRPPSGSAPSSEITLERIMGDPDWLARSPEDPYWADDSQSVYYHQKREGSEIRDLQQVDLDGAHLRTVGHEEMGSIDVAGGDYSGDARRKVYARQGDIYLEDYDRGEIRQLTRTAEEEAEPAFLLGDQQVAFRRGDTLVVRDLASGLEYQPADLRLEDDPEAEEGQEEPGFLEDQQQRLFEFLRRQKQNEDEARDEARAEQEADLTRAPLPFYLGDGQQIRRLALSPNGAYLAVVVNLQEIDRGEPARMPAWVTASGYVETREIRPKVGTGKPTSDRILLLDLEAHRRYDLDLAGLAGIEDDPLAELRAASPYADHDGTPDDAAADPATVESEKAATPTPRPVWIRGVAWADDGTTVAFMAQSADNKDRWIATATVPSGTETAPEVFTRHRLHDEAWINWDFNDWGWLPRSETLWYLSEESGYSHLYLLDLASCGEALPCSPRALTSGAWEVSSPRPTRDGRALYFRANRSHPGHYEVYRVGTESPTVERLTTLGGIDSFALSPDETRLLLLRSEIAHPPEIWWQPATPGATARQITHTVSDEFLALPWVTPEIVPIPATAAGRPIYAKVYEAVGPPPGPDGKRPAVVFIHGAGYLQNAYYGWSYYFHEFMFHSLLAHRGYVVLDMDYRASAGYGRDWRTAIYRRMGWPEVEDLADGVAWLVENENVDAARIGVYGGSYGGFLTMMSMFRRPELFAAGAALRPVTDWAHYNHPYTSDILNTPETDPEAYRRSSPIEFADGLERPLLICHGMVDDNVAFQDSVRLAQRLIELGKQNWQLAVYPVEPHGFRQPSSWLDEYRRIFALFRDNLE